MRHNQNSHSSSVRQSRLPGLIQSARRELDYQILLFMIRIGLIQPAHVRVRSYR
jgi:hypothetical protein